MDKETNSKRTKEEIIKEDSNYLRGTIKEELGKETSHFQETNVPLLKFHGTYQQDNRDTRQHRKALNQEKDYIFMIRTKLPGGHLTPDQYLGLDSICDKYSNKTLRITTRQTIQLHGVIKGNLHKTLNNINKNLIITYGACGDVVRNVLACPVCDIDPEYSINLNQLAREISDHLLPKTRAYYEIWVNGEKVSSEESTGEHLKEEVEPIYGKAYLPRKFKIALATYGDNCVDAFANDIGIIAVTKDKKLQGFNILVGGKLGHTHNRPETGPGIASSLGFVTGEKLIDTITKIVTIHRDFGGRADRKHARMKFVIDDRGLTWFKQELEKRLGFELLPPTAVKEYTTQDHLGWHRQRDGNWYLGLFIENGRISDQGIRKTRSGLRETIGLFKPDIRLTPQQNIVLANIKEEDINEVNKIIEKCNMFTEKTVSPLRRNSMACPALPTCGLALAEAERALPDIINELEKLGFGDEVLSLRMSGCPNSCSRPPFAELGIIGTSANKYNLYVGGTFTGTRLNKMYKENIMVEDIVPEIVKLFRTFRANRQSSESFGDFSNRIGIEQLKFLAD